MPKINKILFIIICFKDLNFHFKFDTKNNPLSAIADKGKENESLFNY